MPTITNFGTPDTSSRYENLQFVERSMEDIRYDSTITITIPSGYTKCHWIIKSDRVWSDHAHTITYSSTIVTDWGVTVNQTMHKEGVATLNGNEGTISVRLQTRGANGNDGSGDGFGVAIAY